MLTNKQDRFLKAQTIKTGLSDFHKMVVSVFKTSFKKKKLKIVTYPDYKRFDNEKFKESLITCFNTGKSISYDAFFANLTRSGTNKTKTRKRQTVSFHE